MSTSSQKGDYKFGQYFLRFGTVFILISLIMRFFLTQFPTSISSVLLTLGTVLFVVGFIQSACYVRKDRSRHRRRRHRHAPRPTAIDERRGITCDSNAGVFTIDIDGSNYSSASNSSQLTSEMASIDGVPTYGSHLTRTGLPPGLPIPPPLYEPPPTYEEAQKDVLVMSSA